jgi:glycosyltransferase involved in cell wall biosynthesis
VSPLRVLHIVEATTAGVGRHVHDLCLHMGRAGLEVMVACPRRREGAGQDVAFVERVAAAGAAVTVVPMRRSISPYADFRAYRALVRLIGREGLDVVHAHSSKAGALGRLAARRAGCPAVVYTPSAFAFLGARRRWSRWLYEGIERWLGRHATDALICVSGSELALARARSIVPSEKLALIENATDLARFGPQVEPAAAKERLGLDPDRPVVGFAGRLTRQKGPEVLLRAAGLVRQSGYDAQFLLVGEGELQGTLRGMVAEHGLEDHVRFTGYQSDIGPPLAAMDIFVLPSLYEGLPYSLMEAMAAGRAVVATRVGGNCDLIQEGETGLLFAPGDVAALATLLLRLLSDPGERGRLGEMAAAAARSRPTPEQMTGQVIALYQRVLDDKASQGHGQTDD